MIASGTILQNRYEIARQLGQGGMGTVYEATDRRFGSTVALKQTLVASEPLKRAFEREARLLNTLQHAALAHVIDYFVEGDGQFLVMQYIPGDDLGQMLRRRAEPFPVEDVLAWADQLLDLLDYLHTHEPPIVHRDIKPENLKLTKRGKIILLDFGLAKGPAEQMATTATSVVGYTPSYAPLEQIRGTGTDARSDLYALAATLYHLLTKKLPPDAVTRAECFVNGRPDPLRSASELNPSVPLPVASALHAALGLRRDERFASASTLRAALGDAGRHGAVTVAGAATRAPGAETQPAGRPTAPQHHDTVMEASEAPLEQTFPATRLAATPPPQPSRWSAASVIALASAAAILLLGVVSVVVYFAFFFDRPHPKPGPDPQPGPIVETPSAPPRVTATASSVRAPIGDTSYGPDLALDGRPGTAWVEGGDGVGVGESITLDLSSPARVTRLRVQPGYFKSPQVWAKNNRLARARILLSDGRELEASFADEMREQAVAIGGGPVTSITITIEEAYLGGDDIDTAISEIAVDTQ